ncbi:MAG: phage holin family protein [Actinomycetota bacterium]|nr:phage holin family protein [Actinomycetota bacterium]
MTARFSPGQAEERPLGELFSDMTSQFQDLLRKEVELAKIETKEQVARAGKGGAMLAAGGVTALFALMLLAFAAAWGLAEAIPTGLAFLAVGLLFGVIAGLMVTQGRKRLAGVKPVPEQTLQTLRQDVEVAKESLQQGASGPAYGNTRRSSQ